MKINKIITLIIAALFSANTIFAEGPMFDTSDFTGEDFFTPPSMQQELQKNSEDKIDDNNQEASSSSGGHGVSHTVPPIKKMRLAIKRKRLESKRKRSEHAPTNPDGGIYNKSNVTSEYASKEPEEKFDADMMADGFEADEEAVEENAKKHFWNKNGSKDTAGSQENTESIILDCDNMDYDTDNYCLYATGNVNVEFVKQKTIIKSDIITYDRMNNTIKAEGNVRIIKNGQVITGDYIFVDMNEENALIEKPVTSTETIEMRANKGYVYGDKIVQEQGTIDIEKSYPIKFHSAHRGPHLQNMLTPKDQSMTEDLEKGLVKFKAKEIIITQKGDLETVAIKHGNVKKNNKTIFKFPAVKIYTNKNHDYFESNFMEIGSYRGLGLYAGPGFVFELPKGSVFKAIPMLNYKEGLGVGALGRFSSGTNQTQIAYGTAQNKVLIHGHQKLDDNLFLQYGMNDYLQEWFLGRRRPKYGIDLVYQKTYHDENFLLQGHRSAFSNRVDFGYFNDIDKDKHFRGLKGSSIGTTRLRYMAEATQNFIHYEDEDKQKSFSFDIAAQLSAALYGTGDTQVIGRLGPRMHSQWRFWMQDIGYFQSVYDDHTPMPVFDAYRYGKSNLYLRETFRLNRYLALSWFSSINLSHDSPNKKDFQENSFYISIGPDDVKFHFGYDFIREMTFFTVEMKVDAKGTHIEYDKMLIKQDKKAKKENNPGEPAPEPQEESDFQQDQYKAPVLQHAVVEDIKTVEDVL